MLIQKNKITIGVLPNKFQDDVFKNTKASDFSNVMVKTVPLDKR